MTEGYRTIDDIIPATINPEQIRTEMPTDISWLLFGYIRPILEAYVHHKRVITIQDAIPDVQQREQIRRQVAIAIQSFLYAGLTHFYAGQTFFEGRMKPLRRVGLETHSYTTKGEQLNDFLVHLRQIPSSSLDTITKGAIAKTLQRQQLCSGNHNPREIHFNMRHGSFSYKDARQQESYPVIFQHSRIKHPSRLVHKFARLLCSGVMEHRELRRRLQAKQPLVKPDEKKYIETLGAMHDYGLQVPYIEGVGYSACPLKMEYLLMRCKISDIFGTTYVTRTRRDVGLLQDDLIKGRYTHQYNYQIFEGEQLTLNRKHNKSQKPEWTYTRQSLVDDHGKPNKADIFLWVVPRRPSSHFDIRIDLGICSLVDYLTYTFGEQSHTLYETRQMKTPDSWPREIQRLYKSIVSAVSGVFEGINIRDYPLRDVMW